MNYKLLTLLFYLIFSTAGYSVADEELSFSQQQTTDASLASALETLGDGDDNSLFTIPASIHFEILQVHSTSPEPLFSSNYTPASYSAHFIRGPPLSHV